MTNKPTLTVRQQVTEFLDRVERNNGQPTNQQKIDALKSELAALQARSAAHGLSPQDREEMEALEETISIMEDPEEVKAIIESYRDYLNGNVIKGVDAVRALRPGWSPTTGKPARLDASNKNGGPTMRQRAIEFLDRVERSNGQLADPQKIAAMETELAELQARGEDSLSTEERERLFSLEETIAVLQDPEAIEAFVEGYRDYLSGNLIEGVEALRPR